MATGRIEAIGFEDKSYKASYSSQVKKRNPCEYIGNIMRGIGSLDVPGKFNSAFTVSKPGAENKGAFLG